MPKVKPKPPAKPARRTSKPPKPAVWAFDFDGSKVKLKAPNGDERTYTVRFPPAKPPTKAKPPSCDDPRLINLLRQASTEVTKSIPKVVLDDYVGKGHSTFYFRLKGLDREPLTTIAVTLPETGFGVVKPTVALELKVAMTHWKKQGWGKKQGKTWRIRPSAQWAAKSGPKFVADIVAATLENFKRLASNETGLARRAAAGEVVEALKKKYPKANITLCPSYSGVDDIDLDMSFLPSETVKLRKMLDLGKKLNVLSSAYTRKPREAQ